VMEQEAEYLAALESAATYSIRGDQLHMRSAADQLAVVMTRKSEIDLPDPEPATPSGIVTAPQGLNIRSGPGVNFPIIGFAQNGDEGEIVGRSTDSRWWAVAVPSAADGIGWVSADFVIVRDVEDVPVIEVAPPVVVVPTLAPTSTPVPIPTATPSPQISFGADQTNIQQGQCTTLRWSVENIQAVWVYPLGENFQNFPRTGQGSEQVCPTTTTTYEMRVLQRNGAVIFRQVTINVAGPTATSAPSNPLAGTSWNVSSYNNGRGAVVSVLEGTTLSITFSADGQVSGSSGCNNFFGSYQVNGSSITIGALGGGQVFCAEPEGVMEQESEFQSALQSAATFSVSGGRLEMRTAGDQLAIVAN
ncbi:MAG: META domain-containing protein, partial [Candidatus Promineifilaceae bacterium]|nr:META domain-containing protein [Candidatus Promineifilaceae bacterium]